MGSFFSPSLIYLSLTLLLFLLLLPKAEPLELKTARVLDSVIRDYTLRSYNNTTFKTGKLYDINLPSNLSGINVVTIRLRCGSLQRYGARVKEFHIDSGVNVHQCIERVILVRQSVSSIYYNTFELSGYELISPILGLMAYNVGGSSYSNISSTPTELEAQSEKKKKITVDFSNATLLNTSSRISPLCASFDLDGKLVGLANQERPNVCAAARLQGHVGLVVEAALMKGKVSKVKIVVVSSIGAALGAFLLSLLVVAMFVNAKKKARMDELERRAYEEEALQVSMVGHVRAVTASGTRTAPTIEHHDHYRVRHS